MAEQAQPVTIKLELTLDEVNAITKELAEKKVDVKCC
jgi:hypothetical protein